MISLSEIFAPKQVRMGNQLDKIVDNLNNEFLAFQTDSIAIDGKRFEVNYYMEVNQGIDFSQNTRKMFFRNTHVFLFVLILFCIMTDYYNAHEIAAHFGIKSQLGSLILGAVILLIEVTLGLIAIHNFTFNETIIKIGNNIGAYLFLFFIPAMCYLYYMQNQKNQGVNPHELALRIAGLKAIIIATFSLIIHVMLMLNLRRGVRSFCDYLSNVKFQKMTKIVKKIAKRLLGYINSIQREGGQYLRDMDRYNRMFPDQRRQIEYLPDGVVSIINYGQGEDIIRMKQALLTHVKKGTSIYDVIKKSMSPNEGYLFTNYIRTINGSGRISNTESNFVRPIPNEVEEADQTDESTPASFENFFSSGEKEL